jgi:hypothetical protein
MGASTKRVLGQCQDYPAETFDRVIGDFRVGSESWEGGDIAEVVLNITIESHPLANKTPGCGAQEVWLGLLA